MTGIDPFTYHKPGTAIRKIADNRDRIIEMRTNKVPETKIAQVVGLSPSRMQAAIADWNFRYPHLRIPPSTKALTETNRAEAVRLAKEGLGFAAIAERLGLSPVTVRLYLQEARRNEPSASDTSLSPRGFSKLFAKLRAAGKHPRLGSITSLAGALPRTMFLKLLDESIERNETFAHTVARRLVEATGDGTAKEG